MFIVFCLRKAEHAFEYQLLCIYILLTKHLCLFNDFDVHECSKRGFCHKYKMFYLH